MKYLFLIILSIFLPVSAQAEPSQSLSGVYLEKFESTRQTFKSCAENEPKYADGRCIYYYPAKNALGLFQKENGDLDVAMHLSFIEGHSRTIDGLAKKIEDSWLLEHQISPNKICKLMITLKDGIIKFDAEVVTDCSAGGYENYDGAEFSLSSKINYTVSKKEDFACISSFEESCSWNKAQGEK